MSDDRNKLPPVLCCLFIDKTFVGIYDNPHALVFSIEEILSEKIDDKKVLNGVKLKLIFSTLNNLNDFPESLEFSKKDISDKKSIIELYDSVIDKYIEDLKLDIDLSDDDDDDDGEDDDEDNKEKHSEINSSETD